MYNFETEIILRKFFNHIRVKNEDKLEMLAKDLDISTSYISQWENNKRALSSELVTKMFSHFGYDPVEVVKEYEKNIEILFSCYLDIVFIKKSDRFKKFEENLPTNFSKSIEYPAYLVIKYLCNCSKYNSSIETEINSLYSFLNEDFSALYYLSMGCARHNSRQFQKAISYFKQGLKISSNAFVTSMLHYNLGNSLNRNSEITESQIELSLAKSQFEQCLVSSRALVCSNALGIIYVDCNRYEDAIKIFEYILRISDYLNENSQSHVVVNNLTWTYLLMGNYIKSYSYCESLLQDYERVSSETYFYIFYNLYKLDRKKELFDKLKEYKALIKKGSIIPDFHHEYIELIELFVKEEATEIIEKKLKNAVETTMKTCVSTGMKLFSLDWIIDYYKHGYNYKKMSKYLLDKNEILMQRK